MAAYRLILSIRCIAPARVNIFVEKSSEMLEFRRMGKLWIFNIKIDCGCVGNCSSAPACGEISATSARWKGRTGNDALDAREESGSVHGDRGFGKAAGQKELPEIVSIIGHVRLGSRERPTPHARAVGHIEDDSPPPVSERGESRKRRGLRDRRNRRH